MQALWMRLEGMGFDRRSLVALGLIAAVCGAVAVNWFYLIDLSAGVDWLLTVIWAVMVGLLIWRIQLRRDLELLFVGLLGGGVIEWWGTQTSLWVYFTSERPPLWILPAWPIAALAIDRMARMLARLFPRMLRWGALYWLVVPAFVLAMTRFLWPGIAAPSSKVVIGLMVFVTLWRPRPGRDLVIFAAGSFLGIFLEYWGTSRHCWTYYTREVPPLEAIFAHGFATIAFARGRQGLGRVRRILDWSMAGA